MAERQLDPTIEPRFLGMIANTGADLPPGFVLLAQNVFLEDGAWVGRPGTVQLGGTLGAGGRVQNITHFEELDGTLHTVAFANGDMYTYNWGTDSWALVDLSANGVTQDVASDVDTAEFRGKLIVTDGVNTPWQWDPAAGTFTVLAAAPVARGVTVYYDKVFFFDLPSSTNVFEWSAEYDATTGYSASGFDWQYGQTDLGRIRAIAAMNEKFLVFKQDAVGMVRGPVNDTFKTDAVREGVSDSEGTVAGKSVVVVGDDVYALAQEGPRRAVGGVRWEDITLAQDIDALKDVWSTVRRADWDASHGVHDPTHGLIIWFVPTTGTDPDYAIVYATTPGAWSVWAFPAAWDLTHSELAEDTSGNEHVLVGTDDGKVYRFATGTYQDVGPAAISFKVRSRLYGKEHPAIVKRITEAALRLDLAANVSNGTTRSNADDTLGSALSMSGLSAVTGKHTYRRGFNSAGYGVGWEVEVAGVGEHLVLEAAVTHLTAVHQHGSV